MIADDYNTFSNIRNISAAKDQASGGVTDVEKGEARASNGSSHFQLHNRDLQRASSKGSGLFSAGKVSVVRGNNNVAITSEIIETLEPIYLVITDKPSRAYTHLLFSE